MGCGGSKPEESGGGGDAIGTEQVDLSVNKEKRMSMTKRRVAVRVDMDEYDPGQDDEEYIEKSPEEKELIMKALTDTDIFTDIKTDELDVLIKGAKSLGVESGEVVIQQGESGDHYYVVARGTFVASLAQQSNKVVQEYGPGQSFGELALLYNAPRAATVTCKDSGMVWAIERKRFRWLVVKAGSTGRAQRVDTFLKSVETLSILTDAQRSQLADQLEEKTYDDAEYVCAQGDIADAMFFVKSGELVATVGDEKKEVARYGASGFFGESCLAPTAETAVRQANIVSVGSSTVLKLTASVFKEQLGDLTELATRNLKRKVLENVKIDGEPFLNLVNAGEEQDQLLDLMAKKSFAAGETIIAQEATNSALYIIEGGSVKVIQKGAPGAGEAERQLAELKQGEYFGERGLVKAEPSMASVVAGDKGAQCMVLDKTSASQMLNDMLKTSFARVIKMREQAALKPELPKYADLELRRILGVGTFGRVKLVVHKPTNRSYALKCMRKAQVVATKQQSHVLNEKNILKMMDHPFILALIQTYQDAGELYMLLDLALGGELFTLLAKRAPLFDSPARFYVACVVSMFSYMHSHKVIYRDLKPENLLLDAQGYLKLVDFGFAKILQDRTWTLCGTPEYLAPEIILNKGHGFGADWWCVGILSFECLTGTTPFVSNDPMEGYRKIIKCRVPWPAQLSALAKDFIDRLLCVDPSRRLGCLKGGAKDVRGHPWFQGLDFKALEARQLPAPYTPKIKSQTDDSNFDQYTDEGKLNYPQEDFPRDMFKDFADEWV